MREIELGKYNMKNIKLLANDPQKLCGVFAHYGEIVNRYYYSRTKNDCCTKVLEEDWDILLILDGCRYDAFAEQCMLNGQLHSIRSCGSASGEFLSNNFADRRLHDTVYVTANPFVTEISRNTFHACLNLLGSHWDEKAETVHPETVADVARDANEDYPQKRLIIHFMQPHYPFIGPYGRELGEYAGIHPSGGEAVENAPIWHQLQYRFGDVTIDAVWRAYRENLKIVLDVVADLLPDLVGKTVISADHGNLIGDRLRPIPTQGFGHPPGLYVPELVNVPWFIVEGDIRRTIESDPPVETAPLDGDVLEDRLDALGYL